MKCLLVCLLAAGSACGQVVVAITARGDDYLVYAGGTLAGMTAQGATLHVICATGEVSGQAREAAVLLGAKGIVSLGYREGELAGVSPTELRDRLIYYIRHYRPRIVFLPNPHAEYDESLDRYHAGLAAEQGVWASSRGNFQPAHALAGLEPHLTAEVYYYAPPVDPRRRELESTATFVPQPKVVDIAPHVERKLRAVQALASYNRRLAEDIRARLAITGRKLPLLESEDGLSRLVETRLRSLGHLAAEGTGYSLAEEFLHAGVGFQVPSAYLR